MNFLKLKYKEAFIWIAYFLILFSIAHYNWGTLADGLEVSFFMVFLHFLIFYGNYYYLMPYTFAKQRYMLFVFCSFLFAIFWFLLAYIGFSWGLHSRNWISPEQHYMMNGGIPAFPPLERLWAIRIGFSGFNVFFISILYYYVEQDKERKQRMWDLEHEKINAEIKLLKMQINPHFLFNALNNIYSKAVLEESKVADSIHKLSSLLRYALYDCDADRIALIKELEYIDNYIDLQKLKDNELDEIDLTVEGAITTVSIAPMLLISFVENAFKHGNITEGGWIKINIQVQNESIKFCCVNSITNSITAIDNTSGIGLENVKKRLALYYPNKHQLTILKKEKEFEINLIINDHQMPNHR